MVGHSQWHCWILPLKNKVVTSDRPKWNPDSAVLIWAIISFHSLCSDSSPNQQEYVGDNTYLIGMLNGLNEIISIIYLYGAW